MGAHEEPFTGPELPADLSDPVFRTVRRGYDPEEVRAYVQRVVDVVRNLRSPSGQEAAEPQEAGSTREAEAASVTHDPYEGVSAYVTSLLRGLDHDVERLRTQASAEAEQTRAEARLEAQMELVKVRLDADRIRSETLALRSSKLEELRTIRDHMVSSLRELEAALEVEPAEETVVVLDDTADEAPAVDGSLTDRTEGRSDPAI